MTVPLRALIGASLATVVVAGAAAAMLHFRAPPVQAPGGTRTTVVARRVGGTTLRLPLPHGYCALNPSNEEDRKAIEGRVIPSANREILVLAIPCGLRDTFVAAPLTSQMQVLFWAARRDSQGRHERPAGPRAEALRTMREDHDGRYWRQAEQISGNTSTRNISSVSSVDEQGIDLRMRGTRAVNGRTVQDQCTGRVITIARGLLIDVSVSQACQGITTDDNLLPVASALIGPLLTLNPDGR